jgi:hypothetical protein
MSFLSRLLCRVALAVVLSVAAGKSALDAQTLPAEAPPKETAPELSASQDFGYGLGSVVANFFYMPAKVTYAGLGLVTGGLAFVLTAGNTDVATNIIHPSIRGNYVVTPQHLRGEEPLVFVGPTDQAIAPTEPLPPAQSGPR